MHEYYFTEAIVELYVVHERLNTYITHVAQRVNYCAGHLLLSGKATESYINSRVKSSSVKSIILYEWENIVMCDEL